MIKPIDKEDKLYEPAEIYGQIMQYLHFKKEEKNLQYISNEIFKAACQDLQLYNKDGWKKDAQGSGTKYLDQYLETLAVAIINNPENNNKSVSSSQLVVAMKKEISAPYEKLKQNLNDVRIFGVGKGFYEKTAATLGIITRGVIAPAISLGIITLGGLVMATGIAMEIKGIRGAIKGSSNLIKNIMDVYVGKSIEGVGRLGVEGGMLAGVAGSYKSLEMHDVRNKIKNSFRENVGGGSSIGTETKRAIKTRVLYKDQPNNRVR